MILSYSVLSRAPAASTKALILAALLVEEADDRDLLLSFQCHRFLLDRLPVVLH